MYGKGKYWRELTYWPAVNFSRGRLQDTRLTIINLQLWDRSLSQGTPRHRCEDNIKMCLREIGWGGMEWIDLVQNRDQWKALVNTVMNLRVPWNIRKFLRSCAVAASQEGLSSMELVNVYRICRPGYRLVRLCCHASPGYSWCLIVNDVFHLSDSITPPVFASNS
jgi:hypothetical protein